MKKNFRNIAFNFLSYICHVKQIFKLWGTVKCIGILTSGGDARG